MLWRTARLHTERRVQSPTDRISVLEQSSSHPSKNTDVLLEVSRSSAEGRACHTTTESSRGLGLNSSETPSSWTNARYGPVSAGTSSVPCELFSTMMAT